MSRKIFCVIGCSLCLASALFAQEIPIGTWRSHISYNRIHTIAASQNNVFAASDNGIVMVNKTDGSTSVLNKVNGLTAAGITSIAFDINQQQLLVTYQDGDLDIVTVDGVVNYNQLKNSTTISGSKRINQVVIRNDLAYLATDYGVVLFDLNLKEVKESWRDLGVGGVLLSINQSTFVGDSIFLATAFGVLAGDIKDNLLDYNNWKRFNAGAFAQSIKSIVSFNNKLYAAIDNSGIYEYANGTWNLVLLPGESFTSLTSSSFFLYVCDNSGLKKFDLSLNETVVTDQLITNPIAAFENANLLWIGDAENGLVKNASSLFENFLPNGISFNKGQRLSYDDSNNKVYAVSGGYTATFTQLNNEAYLNVFSSGSWSTSENYFSRDLTDIVVHNTKKYLASFGFGLQVIDQNEVVTTYTADDSPLQNEGRITAMAKSTEGVWIANYASSQPLHLLNDAGWESFSFPIFASQFIIALEVDFLGNVWMALDPNQGGGILVFKKSTNNYVYLTETTNGGGLPNRAVYSLAADRDGQIWVGTQQGIAYFPNPGNVFSGSVNAVRPIFENRFLLRDEKITSIAIDGGNRKWIGTQNGVWLFKPFGESLVYNFNKSNSPLLSNYVIDIAIHHKTGEAFFLTDEGVVSFRSDATSSTRVFQVAKIFPNPVTNKFNGQVGIEGLSTDAIVKITDVAGKLVWQTTANGGTAVWNVRDYNGNRVNTGVYLVFCTSQDGIESIVGKIAVID